MTAAITVSSVLLVEDRSEDLRFITEIVRDAFGPIEVRSARTLDKARGLLERFAPDLVVLDLNLPDGTGASLIPTVRARHANAWVVVVTVFDDDEHLFTALQHGADGYLLKDESRAVAARILQDVLAGRPPLSARVARRVLRYVQSTSPKVPASPMPDLTPRERDVLILLARGHTAGSAAALLGISEHTIRTHVKSLYRKLDVSSRASMVRAALDEGLT